MTRVFTIPADCCFVTTLANGLWRRVEGDPLALAAMQIYLPTRRACRALREAFLQATGGRAALLPRMQPLGDVDEVDLDFAGADALSDLPPAIAPLRRQMLLAKLVRAKDSSLPWDQAAQLAASLAVLLDQVQTTGLDFADLHKLAPDDYAAHWQETLQFLEIVTASWPAILAEEGAIDPAARRAAVLKAQADMWRKAPPDFPVIAAGSTGSVPAVGELMGVIASLPQGEVILPGLDLRLEEDAWQEVADTHPQATMKAWLEAHTIKRSDVRVWEDVTGSRGARVRLLSEAMRPPEVSEAWRDLTPTDIPAVAAEGVERIDLDHHREEADVIALRLRAALEEPGKTAALVTPDRALAARVASALRRWGIEVNDSAGSALSTWPVGSFLIDVLRAAAPNASPVDYLTLFKHPLAAGGLTPFACREAARTVEEKVWRGVRRTGGLAGAARAMGGEDKPIAAWLERMAALFARMTEGWCAEQSLPDLIEAHIALAEQLAATESESGAARLWRGEAGEAAVAFFDDWRASAGALPKLSWRDYAALFGALIDAALVRPAYGVHPRLHILGPLEARLVHHDLMILGGLNEGTWPPAPPVDPWLSRPMKAAFGLPSPERRVGLSAHDFVQLATAPHVLMTRAARVGGAPTVPSRFLLQMDTVLQAVGLQTKETSALAPREDWRGYARAFDQPEAVRPMAPPAPCPPTGARPQKLSVTEIGTWLRNPYAIYARHVLRLKKLEDIDADVTAAEKGNVIHEALENFVRLTMKEWPQGALALLLEEGRKAFAPFADRPQVMAFWWPRFEKIAAWFVAKEEERRAEGIRPIGIESKGVMKLKGLTLTGRADRIDALEAGVAIIDYKTGAAPTAADVLRGVEPQLPLLALMAAAGAFEEIGVQQAAELAYWELHGSKAEEKITSFAKDLDEMTSRAQEGLEALIEAFARADTPYHVAPRPAFAPRYDDYAHLARAPEWGRTSGNGGEA